MTATIPLFSVQRMFCGFTLTTVQSEGDLLKCVLCSSTLRDPVILKCLHSACKSCTCQVTNVTCTVCKVTTETSVANCNFLVSALIHRSDTLKRVHSCMVCTGDGNNDESSVVWCYRCQLALCADCDKNHTKLNKMHDVTPISENTTLSDLYRAPLRLCASHDEEMICACFTCREGRCRKCVHGCYTSCHVVELLDDPAAADRLKRMKAEAAGLLSDLNFTNKQLDVVVGLTDVVTSAREKSISTLKMAKKTAIDSISKAYENAESSLLECWEKLTSKAVLLRESAENLKERLDWTNQYCQVALKTDDIAGLLPQLSALCSSLCNLLEETKQIAEPIEPSKLVRMDVRLPRDLDSIATDWFGLPQLVSDDFYISGEDIFSELSSTFNSWEAPSTPLRFDDTPRGTFRGSASCMDVALTPQGRLLVAAAQDGLKEYDVTDFREITTWEPPMTLHSDDSSIVCVCALDDGRAVVGIDPKMIVVLRRDDRNGEEWVVEKCSKNDSETDDSDCCGSDNSSSHDESSSNDGNDSAIRGKCDDMGGLDSEATGDCCSCKDERGGGTNCEAVNRDLKDGDEESASDRGARGDEGSRDERDNDKGNTSDDTSKGNRSGYGWKGEFFVVQLQASPARLSTWGDRLLAVLEDPLDELELISLNSGERLVRLRLDYTCISVALTDRFVAVASMEEVKLTEKSLSGGSGTESQVIDCYSHAGVRLWRHVASDSMRVLSLCSDSVARVLCAATITRHGNSVVTLSVDSGRQIDTALKLGAQDDEGIPLALDLDRSTRRLIAVLTSNFEDFSTLTVHTAV